MTRSYYQYAEIMLQRKGLTASKELLQKAEKALKAAYEGTTYTAVAFDVDGTLTQEHGTKVTREMAIAVLGLAKRGVPVLLITGRGRSSTKDAVKQIIRYSQPGDYGWISLVSAITHNGVLLLQSQKPIDISVVTSNEYLLSEEVRLKEPNPKLKDYYNKLLKKEEFQSGLRNGLITIQLEPTHNLPPNGIRIAVRNDSRNYSILCDIAKEALKDIKESIESPEQFTLSHGWFGNYCVLDLFNTNKVEGLKIFADMMMIPLDEILRIGDQGDEAGNDFEFLNSPRGFSVGEVSKICDKCFPVINNEGNVLMGSKAVNELLRRVRILPPLSLRTTYGSKWAKKKHHDDIQKKMLWFEYNASKRANEEKELLFWSVKNTIKSMLPTSGMKLDLTALDYNDIFENLNGGIKIYNWELLELNENHPFRLLFGLTHEFICCPNAVNFKWAMPTDDGILLRGPYYYWMMMYGNDYHPMDTSYLDMYYWVSIDFIQSSIEAIIKEKQSTRWPKLVTYKLLLGILDNIRNIIIQWWYAVYLLSSMVQLETEKIKLRTFLEGFFRKVFYKHTKFFIKVLLGTWSVSWNRSLTAYTKILEDVGHYVEGARSLSKSTVKELSSEKIALAKPLIRKWREVDDFLEAVLAVKIGLTEIRRLIETTWPEFNNKKNFSLKTLGLAYGGIELPAIANALAEDLDVEVIPGFALMSFYSNQEIRLKTLTNAIREEYFERKKRESFIPSIFFIGEKDHTDSKAFPVVIMDDNCTTARTLSYARKWLVEEDYIVPGSIIVRYPGVNRFLQMLLPNHGAPNPDMLLSFIRGLVSPSPYSRLVRDVSKEAFHNETEGKKVYLDCTGVFDLSRNKIKKLLVKSQRDPNVKICDIKDIHMARFCGRMGVDMIGIHAIYNLDSNLLKIFERLVDEIKMYFPYTKVVLVTKIRDAEKLKKILDRVDIRAFQIYVFNENDVEKIGKLEQEDMQNQVVQEIVIKIVNVISSLKEYERQYFPGIRPVQFIITLPIMGIPIKHIKFSIKQLLPYADYFLFDTSARGGTGSLADLNRIRELLSYTKNIKTFIAGGLNPTNIKEVLNRLMPYKPFGVDVQTGVEIIDPFEAKKKGKKIKSPQKIIRFVSAVQGVNDRLYAKERNADISKKLFVRARKRKILEKPYLVTWAITDFPINNLDNKQADYWRVIRKTDIDALHIDWSDGSLAPKFVRNDFTVVKKLIDIYNIPGINYELHLMVKKTSLWIDIIKKMLDINPFLNLVYFHFYPNMQYVKGLTTISGFLKERGVSIGIAVETRLLEVFMEKWAPNIHSDIGLSGTDFSIVTRKSSHGNESLEKDIDEISRMLEKIKEFFNGNSTYLSLDRNMTTEKLQKILSTYTKDKDGGLFNKVIVGGEIINALKETQNLDIWERIERIQSKIDKYRKSLQGS